MENMFVPVKLAFFLTIVYLDLSHHCLTMYEPRFLYVFLLLLFLIVHPCSIALLILFLTQVWKVLSSIKWNLLFSVTDLCWPVPTGDSRGVVSPECESSLEPFRCRDAGTRHGFAGRNCQVSQWRFCSSYLSHHLLLCLCWTACVWECSHVCWLLNVRL